MSIACPNCGSAMGKKYYPDIITDVCPDCGGIFFDRGELNTMAVGMGGPRNAGLFAVQILATSDNTLADKLAGFKEQLEKKIAAKDARLQENIKEDG